MSILLPQHTVLFILLPQHTVLFIRITTALCTVLHNYHNTLRVPPLLLPKSVTHCCRLLHCLNLYTLAMPLAAHHVCPIASFCVTAASVLFCPHWVLSGCLVSLKTLPPKLFGEKLLKTGRHSDLFHLQQSTCVILCPCVFCVLCLFHLKCHLNLLKLEQNSCFLSCLVSSNSPRM